MGNYFFLQVFTVIFALSIATTIFNKRILGFPQAIGVPIVSAIFVFILQWGASLLSGNQFITINIHNIEDAVRHIDFYDFLINGVICFILTSSALKFKVSDLRSHWKPISILASIALVLLVAPPKTPKVLKKWSRLLSSSNSESLMDQASTIWP